MGRPGLTALADSLNLKCSLDGACEPPIIILDAFHSLISTTVLLFHIKLVASGDVIEMYWIVSFSARDINSMERQK